MEGRPGALGSAFRRLWAASAASNLADGVAMVAWPWLASAVTRDPLALAAMGLLAGLPWLLFSLPIGVFIDRIDRGRLIGACDAARAVILAAVAGAVAVFGADLSDPAGGEFVPPAHPAAWLALLYGAAFGLGIIEVARDSASQAFLPQLVAATSLERGNGRLMSTEVVANSLAGPPLGGLLVGVALFLPFAANSAAYALAAVLVLAIGPRRQSAPAPPSGFRAELTEGMRWLWRHTLLRRLAVVLGLVNLASALAMATAVLFAQEVLGADGARYGLMMTGGAVGGVIGGLAAARIAARYGAGTVISTATLVFGLVFLTASQMTRWQAVWALIVVESFAVIVWNVVTVSLRQRLIPQPLFGRVNSVYRFLSWGLIPVGTLAGGALVAVLEPALGRQAALRAPFAVGGLLTLCVLVLTLSWLTDRRIAAAQPQARLP